MFYRVYYILPGEDVEHEDIFDTLDQAIKFIKNFLAKYPTGDINGIESCRRIPFEIKRSATFELK